MQKKNRIHISHDEHGPIEVFDDGFQRTLNFGTAARQSAMYLHDHMALALAYTQVMLHSLLFMGNPKKVLVIGLGGGSLVKFLHHNFPDCLIDVVELRSNVSKIAHSYFGLKQSEKIQIFHADALEFVTHAHTNKHKDYDLIFVDAYQADDIASTVTSMDFFSACRERLSNEGVMSANLWSSNHHTLQQNINIIKHVFEQAPIKIPVEKKGNLIVICGGGADNIPEVKTLKKRALMLDKAYQLGICKYLKYISPPSSAWQRLIS